MMRWLALALMVVLSAFAATATGVAQEGVRVGSNTATNAFPDGITFRLDAEAPAPIVDVRLVYEIAPDGVRTTVIPECAGTTVLSCRYQLAGGIRNVLVPGAEITYAWRLGDTETGEQRIVYEDTRFTWSTLTEGNVTVWYYTDEGDAQAVLVAAQEALDETGALLGASVDFPIKVLYYASAQDMQLAIISSATEGVVTLGEVVYSDTAMVSADAAPLDIARHEVAHIVIREAVRGPYDIPAWLNEGTAVYAQREPLSGQRQAVERAIASGDVLSVRSMSSASSGDSGERVFLFYGQSWSLVDFLIREHGEAKFAELFRTFKAGASVDGALEQVYGFDQDGLENAWRASLGLPPRATPEPADGERAAPTAEPETDASAGGGGDGTPVGLIAGIIAITAGLAAALVALGVVLARRYG